MSLSIIIPTLGRESLMQTVASLQRQLEPADEVLIVTDGKVEGIGPLYGVDDRVRVVWGPRTACWGNAQRDMGMQIATGTHLLFIDDDDVYEPGALELVRAAIADEPTLAHIFRMRFGAGHPAGPLGARHGPVWEDKSLRASNIGTPMVVLPNRPDLPRWADGDDADHLSDFVFLRRAVSRVGGAVWHEPCIAVVRP